MTFIKITGFYTNLTFITPIFRNSHIRHIKVTIHEKIHDQNDDHYVTKMTNTNQNGRCDFPKLPCISMTVVISQ